MKFEVTREDILKGKRVSAEFCPIAMAVRRVTNRKDVSVNGYTIKVDGISVPCPPEATSFISKFDSGTHVEPLELDVPIDAAVTLDKGSVIKVSREVTVESVNGDYVTAADGYTYYMPTYKVEVVSNVPATPDNWPPVKGDKWFSNEGSFHYLGSSSFIRAYNKDGYAQGTPESLLKERTGLKLLHRDGKDY